MKFKQTLQILSAVLLAFAQFFSFTLYVVSSEIYDCNAGRHNYTVTVTEASEGQDGEVLYACELCGHSYREILLAQEHSWSGWTVDKEPTCTGEGRRYRTCTLGVPHTAEETVPAMGHDYKVSVEEPSCMEGGMKIYTCTRCGDTYKEAYKEAAGHRYTEEITVKPTCEKEGLKTYICTQGDDRYTEPVPAIGHRYAVEAVTDAACETDGVVTWQCRNCGGRYSDTTKAAGHDYGDWVTDKNPNLTEEGHKFRVCKHDSAHVLEETIPRAITFEVTPADAVIGTVNLGFLFFFGFILMADLYVIRWDAKKRRELLERRRGGNLK